MTATLRKPKTSARAANPGNRNGLAAGRAEKARSAMPPMSERAFPEADKTAVEDFVSTIQEAWQALDWLYDGVLRADFDGFGIDHKVASDVVTRLEEIILRAGSIRQFILDGEYHLPPQGATFLERLAKRGLHFKDERAIIEVLLDRLDIVEGPTTSAAQGQAMVDDDILF